jgi:hypothetical protein
MFIYNFSSVLDVCCPQLSLINVFRIDVEVLFESLVQNEPSVMVALFK